eukprot:scaffold306886_cov39-Prasinocladus_malaysianus.AAC.1
MTWHPFEFSSMSSGWPTSFGTEQGHQAGVWLGEVILSCPSHPAIQFIYLPVYCCALPQLHDVHMFYAPTPPPSPVLQRPAAEADISRVPAAPSCPNSFSPPGASQEDSTPFLQLDSLAEQTNSDPGTEEENALLGVESVMIRPGRVIK